MKFRDTDAELNYEKINHYIPERLLVYLGVDVSSDDYYSGSIGLVRANFGPGSFKKDK